ncbi:MAG: type I-E CRISPR-associated protein Cas6/Cse3/CasE [Rhodomicrobium sp.]
MNAIEPRPIPDTLTFLRLAVDMRQLYKVARERGWGKRGRTDHFDEGRALHHALTETFGEKALPLFRLLVAPGKVKGALYAYSTLPEKQLRQTAELCAHEYDEALGIKDMRAKAFPTRFAAGARLGFDLRVRPVRRTKSAQNKSGVREIDAFLHEALQHENDPAFMANTGRTRERVYTDWLSERFAGAAALEADGNGIATTALARFNRGVAVRRNAESSNRGSEGPDAVIHGTLVVADKTAFAALLANGIGRHKAYGYGMLLLRPPTPRRQEG